MHNDYWGLNHSPFASQLDPADYYPSPPHEEALARLDFLIDNGRRLGYLMGSSGTGKSLLLEVATRQLRRRGCHVVKLNVVGLSGQEFVWKMASGLGHHLAPDASALECWRGISDRLIANRYQRLSTVILLDDFDEADREVQSAINRLCLIDQHPEARLTVVLAAQRPRAGSFSSKLEELCELRIDLEPWEAAETAGYIRHSMEQAGGQPDCFEEDALEHLHSLSRGLPRRIRQLAELSLLAGAAEELQQISSSVIESVHRSLTNDGVRDAA